MAIANGTCVSICTFWPPLGTRAPGTFAVNVTRLNVVKRIAACTHLSSTVFQ